MRHLDIVLQKRDLSWLYSSLTTKLNGFLMTKIPPETAELLHKKDLPRYSMFTLEQPNNIMFRLSVLSDEATPLYDAVKNTRLFDVDGIEGGVAVLDIVEHEKISVDELFGKPPSQFKMLFASPATYRHGSDYTNVFAIQPLLYSVTDKLRLFENIDVTNAEIKVLCETIKFPNYKLSSEEYKVKGGSIVPGFVGEMHVKLCGTMEQNTRTIMLFRYAQYTGLGAKTALGMGGVLIDEI